MMIEPRLTDEDRRRWAQWERLCLRWSKMVKHKLRIKRAQHYVIEMLSKAPTAYVALSGGKDSTALIALLVETGLHPRVMSIKDDLDFPGEEGFVRGICSTLGVEVDILHPPFSLRGWIIEHANELIADEDFHSRTAAFSKAAFYGVIDEYRESKGSPGVYLGLRKGESHGRLMNRITHGPVYWKQSTNEWVCQPLCDWSGEDVFAYLLARDLPILDVYRCCAMHETPAQVRKSWWLPGAHSRHGGMVWLKRYYPSLFAELRGILIDASRLA